MMKKVVPLLTLCFLVFTLMSTSIVSAKSDLKEGVEVFNRDGYQVTITTKIVNENIDELVSNLKSQGITYSVNRDAYYSINGYMQEDEYFGNGVAYSTNGDYGICWTNDLFIGLDPLSGVIQGDVFAWSNDSNVSSRPRVTLTTWGMVGGTIGVVKEYTFTGEYGSGDATSLSINEYLTGAIALTVVNVYGDHKKSNTLWTSKATLQKK